MKIAIIFCCLILYCFVFVFEFKAQTNSSDIYVESWSVEDTRQGKFSVSLTSPMKEHSQYVDLWGDRPGYKFEFLNLPASDKEYKLEYWVVLLKQVLSKQDAEKEKLSCNLLIAEGCGGGGDNLPKEDKIGYLFPRETAKTQAEQILSGNFYPISAKRVIKVKSIYVII